MFPNLTEYKGILGGKTLSSIKLLLVIIAISSLGVAPSALWIEIFPSGENLTPSAELTHSTSRRKAYPNMQRANKRLCSRAGSSRTVGCGPNTSPL